MNNFRVVQTITSPNSLILLKPPKEDDLIQKPSQSSYLLCCSQYFFSIFKYKIEEEGKTTILISDTLPSTLSRFDYGSTTENLLITKHLKALRHFEVRLTSIWMSPTGKKLQNFCRITMIQMHLFFGCIQVIL